MEESEFTWERIAKVAWTFSWHWILYSAIAGTLAALAMGDREFGFAFAAAIFIPVYLGPVFFAVKHTLGTTYSDFKVTLVSAPKDNINAAEE